MKISISQKKIQKNQLVLLICTILFFSFSHNCHAQFYLDTYKTIKTEEEWNKALDSLFYKGIADSTMDASAILRIKVDESGKILSAHIIKSKNIDTSLFYRICATIENRYCTPFLRNEYLTYQNYLENGYLFEAYMFRNFK